MPSVKTLLERVKIAVANLARRASGNVKVKPTTYFKAQKSSSLRLPSSTQIGGRYFYVGNKSSVVFDQDCVIHGYFHVGDNCRVEIGKHFRMTHYPSFVVDDNSTVRIGDYCVFDETPHAPASISVKSGSLSIDRNVTIRGSIKVSGGELSIGSDTFLNHGSEVRSEATVVIGSHVLVSYFVDIFDTNTHSTDWRGRHREIDDGFPNGTVQTETNRPETTPINIGDDVWIGKYSAVLKGVTIGARSIIGTRSVVTKSCPDDSIVFGNPASHRPLSTDDKLSNDSR